MLCPGSNPSWMPGICKALGLFVSSADGLVLTPTAILPHGHPQSATGPTLFREEASLTFPHCGQDHREKRKEEGMKWLGGGGHLVSVESKGFEERWDGVCALFKLPK